LNILHALFKYILFYYNTHFVIFIKLVKIEILRTFYFWCTLMSYTFVIILCNASLLVAIRPVVPEPWSFKSCTFI